MRRRSSRFAGPLLRDALLYPAETRFAVVALACSPSWFQWPSVDFFMLQAGQLIVAYMTSASILLMAGR